MTGIGSGLTLVLATGLVLAGGAALDSRRRSQRYRLARYSDSAPPRTRRAPLSERGAITGHAVTINRPRGELYAFWRDFSNLPRFMDNVEKVTTGPDGRTTWTIAAPGGFSVDLVAEITDERDDETIAWRSVEGSDIEAEGRVSFRDAPPGRGTIVSAEVAYRPPGGEVGRWIAKLFQREPGIQGRRELKRFKMLLETGEVATSRNRKET
jgi:uncharacterized membrane protein